jgi:GTP diphosphokinase / guanosine-3',5'-bis(diphosphate) 3'-diphosphatase
MKTTESKELTMEIGELIQQVTSYTDSSRVETVLTTAFQLGSTVHDGFQLLNGAPFISHPLAVARILAEWHAPLPVVTIGLLHDIQKPGYSHSYNLDDIEIISGAEIFKLLKAIISLNNFMRQIERNFEAEVDVVNLQHYMTSVLQQEPDAVVIKMADRLHNLQTISELPRSSQERVAHIGFNLLSPLANRLGMGAVKRLLEDYSFEVINPVQYKMLKQRYAEATFHQHVREVHEELGQRFSESILKCEVLWQPTSFYSLYRHQIEQNAKRGKSLYAELARLRIVDAGVFILLTEEEEDCYRVLGSLHKLYQPVKGQFRDLIGEQKENGYRSLHTQVKHSSGITLSIVIRTRAMHVVIERGITARWWHVPEELLPQLPRDTKRVNKKIQVYAADGQIKELPQSSIVLDFAYSIHTDVGHSCVSALVNGEHAEIYKLLQSGDRIEIIAGGPSTQPSLEWLEHVQTSHAVNAIRQWLMQYQLDAILKRGRKLLNQQLQPLGLDASDPRVYQLFKQLTSKERLVDMEDFLAAIGVGRLNASKLAEQLKSMQLKLMHSLNSGEIISSIRVLSSDEAGLPSILAKCCQPVPFDDIVAYRQNNNTLIVHKRNCLEIKDLEKLVSVGWDTESAEHYVAIVEALNRPGLANDLTSVISQSGIDMPSFSAHKHPDGVMAEAHIYLGKTTSAQRHRIQYALQAVPYVTRVEFMLSSFFASSTSQPLTQSAHRSNPYSPGIAKGPRFYGRQVECERISALLSDSSQNNAILIWGQRRIGKTSLVIRLQECAQGNFLPVYIDLQGLKDGSTIHFLHQVMSGISRLLKEQPMHQELDPPAPNRLRKDPLSYFDTFMIRVQKIAEHAHLVIILDEFQCLCSLREEIVSRSAIFSRLRNQSQHAQGVQFVLSGGGLFSQLVDQPGIAALFNVTHNEKLGYLEANAARLLIKDGLTQVGSISDTAIDLLLDLTAGHPYYLQLLCSELYEQTQGHRMMITSDFAKQCINNWLNNADKSRFQHLWEGYDTESARRNKLTLSAIADLRGRNDEVEYERLARSLRAVITEKQLIQTLEDLTTLGVLKHNSSLYAIEVELFTRWLRQHWPLALTIKEGDYL